jgi:hypothetical protein
MTAYHDQDYGTAAPPAQDEQDEVTGTAAGGGVDSGLVDSGLVDSGLVDSGLPDEEDDADFADDDAADDDAEDDDAEDDDAADDDVIVVAEVIDVSEEPGTASQDPVASADPVVAAGQGQASANLSQQWHDIQARFVDDPADAVRLAAQATETAVTELVSVLQSRQSALTSGPASTDQPDTEQLRSILRECRTLCQDVAEMGRRLTQTAAS